MFIIEGAGAETHCRPLALIRAVPFEATDPEDQMARLEK